MVIFHSYVSLPEGSRYGHYVSSNLVHNRRKINLSWPSIEQLHKLPRFHRRQMASHRCEPFPQGLQGGALHL